jgi:two-component system, LytTR family, response regulator
MNTYKAVIIDDEKMARALTQGMLAEFCPQVDVMASCVDLASGLEAIRNHKPDLVFLDIEMPGSSGLELFDYFPADEIDFAVIFVTAYNQYAAEAFKISAVEYLLKPYDPQELTEAVERAIINRSNTSQMAMALKDNLANQEDKRIAVYQPEGISYVSIQQINRILSDSGLSQLLMKDGAKLVSQKAFSFYEDLLADKGFVMTEDKQSLINSN